MSEKPMRAFPHNVLQYEEGHGMTLRDFFAAKAINSLNITYHAGPNGTSCRPIAKDVANYAYMVADAMLEARKA
jgi:hypothetical protein